MTSTEMQTLAQTVALAVAQALAAKPVTEQVAEKVSKPKASKAKSSKSKASKPKAAPKAAKKTYEGPYAVKVQFSKTGGLIMHGGARVFYRPEGTEEEQIAWLEHNGLDGALYVGLVKSPKHKNVWLTYAESKAKRS